MQSTTSDLALPNGGPLLHLHARKATKLPATDASGASGSPAAPRSALPAMRLLHPFSTETEQYQKIPDGDVIAPCQHTDRKLQRVRLSTFIRIASNLERFNSQPIPTWKRRDRDREFQGRRLVLGSLTGGEEAAKLPATNSLWTTALLAALRRISDLRCEATDANGLFHERANTTMRRLFMSTLCAAISLHVFAHWETHHCEESHKESSNAVQPTTNEPPAANVPVANQHGNPNTGREQIKAPPVSPVRWIAGGLVLALGEPGDVSLRTGRYTDATAG